jgi:four helix bundle protein
MKENILQTKSFNFALKVITFYKTLSRTEFVLSKQLLRSGTSIGANVEEALGGHTRKDFSAKLSIAYKEARETKYWLLLLEKGGYVQGTVITQLISDNEELLKLLGSIKKNLSSDQFTS